MPVNLRPPEWKSEVVTNYVSESRVAPTPKDRRTSQSTIDGIAARTTRIKEGGGAALMDVLGRTARLPLWLKQPLSPFLWMTGNRSDAEDIVHEAFIRWMRTDRSAVREPEAYLRRTVTRLCLDELKSARHERLTYVGPWLPEPVMEDEHDEDFTLPLMLALERLSPLERAVFLLHDVFGLEFAEVAATIRRDTAACRQLAARARTHVREAKPRFQVDRKRGLSLAEAFFAASRGGDMQGLRDLLAEDVSLHADGGGKRAAATEPLLGLEAVMKLHEFLAKRFAGNVSKLVRVGFINGLPGFITLEADGELQTTALDIEDGRITAIYVVRNPDKLRHLH